MTRAPLHIASTYMDFVTAVEADILFPIAFRNRRALNAWVSANDLCEQRIGRFDMKKSAVLVSGQVRVWPSGGRYYSQVWVRVTHRGYRNSILRHIKESNDFSGAVAGFDADHAVSKKRLSELWPDAWVNLTLVKGSINRSIGSMLEKDPLEVDGADDVINANLEFILKLLLRRGEKLTRNNIQEYFDDVSKRFVTGGSSLDEFVMASNADSFLTEIAKKNRLQNRRSTSIAIISSSGGQ